MSFARPFHRPRAIVAGLAIAICAVVGYWVLQGLGFVRAAQRSEQIGPFEITYTKYDAYGLRGTGRTLHYHSASGRMLVSRELGAFELNPNHPAGIVFEHCRNGERPECGIHYFDGQRGRSWKVSNEQLLNQPVPQSIAWSTDGRFLVLTGEYHLQVVQLEKPTVLDVSDALALNEGLRSVRLGKWSPDSRKFTALVSQYIDPIPPFVNVAEDLVVIDAETGSARYVATAQGHGWGYLGYGWQLGESGYAAIPASEGRGIGWRVYRKVTDDLPPSMGRQWP